MAAAQLNSTPVITCDHTFILCFWSYCGCDHLIIKQEDFFFFIFVIRNVYVTTNKEKSPQRYAVLHLLLVILFLRSDLGFLHPSNLKLLKSVVSVVLIFSIIC